MLKPYPAPGSFEERVNWAQGCIQAAIDMIRGNKASREEVVALLQDAKILLND